MTAVAAIAMLAGNAPASAATGASDTATPVYRTDGAAGAANRFSCFGTCEFVINTKTTAFPCNQEVVVLPGGLTPALLYPGTFCQVTISGRFSPIEVGGVQCGLVAVQALKVRFTSGANAGFNGSFDATGTFKPTAFGTGIEGERTITQAQVTVSGTDTLDLNPLGTGTIAGTSFTVRFPSPGLYNSTMCFPITDQGKDGYVSSVVSHGTIVIAP